jgi:hypothetical protein
MGKTARNEVIDANLNPKWCEHIFSLKFTELCRRNAGQWLQVPLGASDDGIDPPPEDLLTRIKVMYPQKENEFCLVNSLVSAMHYLGYTEEAVKISHHADELASIPGNEALQKVVELMQKYLPDWGLSTVYNR